MSKPLLIDRPPIFSASRQNSARYQRQLMKQINHTGRWERALTGEARVGKGFNLSHSSGLQSPASKQREWFPRCEKSFGENLRGKKNAARARGKPDYAAWNKTEGSFNARLKAVGSVKLWIPVICIAADCRLNNAQLPFPHFFFSNLFSNRFSFFPSFSLFFFFFLTIIIRSNFQRYVTRFSKDIS